MNPIYIDAVAEDHNFCVYRVVRANQIPLTGKYPRLVRYWEIPKLNDGQADRISIAEYTPTSINSTNTEISLVRALHKIYEGLCTGGAVRLPSVLDLYEVVRLFFVSLSL